VYTTNSSLPGAYSHRRRRLLPIEFVVELDWTMPLTNMRGVTVDGNADTCRDVEWARRMVERIPVRDPNHIGIDQLGLEQADDLARLQPVLIVRQVIDARLRREPPHMRYPRRLRAEPGLHESPHHAVRGEMQLLDWSASPPGSQTGLTTVIVGA
jgi:hypothetical protein